MLAKQLEEETTTDQRDELDDVVNDMLNYHPPVTPELISSNVIKKAKRMGISDDGIELYLEHKNLPIVPFDKKYDIDM